MAREKLTIILCGDNLARENNQAATRLIKEEMTKMIAIIDYGAGNLQSVSNALEHMGAPHFIASSPGEIAAADSVILPGVGAFGHAMSEIDKRGMAETVKNAARSGKPFLGICVGMQLLFEGSEENPGVPGLGLLPGKVVRFHEKDGLKIPHMGWNQIKIIGQNPIFAGLSDSPYMYFVHSYCALAGKKEQVSATSEYGMTFDAAVEDGRLFGVQFHPEKSGELGHRILRNFIALGTGQI